MTSTAEKSELGALIAQADSVDSNAYTLESTSALLSAREGAKAAFTTAAASQEAVDEQAVALGAALAGLVAAGAGQLDVDAVVTPQTRGRKVVLSVSVANNDSVTVDVVITTPHGVKTVKNVKPGKTKSATIDTKLGSIPAGEVAIEVTGTVDGESITETRSIGYGAFPAVP